jgi:hypothetical protein
LAVIFRRCVAAVGLAHAAVPENRNITQRRIQMRTKIVLAILLGMIGGTLRSSPLSAGQVGIPGGGCKMISTLNEVEASGTTFFGPNVTNTGSSSGLSVYCPVSLNTSSNPRTLKAYGNYRTLLGSSCIFYYATSATTFTNLVAPPFSLATGEREVDFTLPTTPISNGVFICSVGPSFAYFYNVVVNTQF